MIDMDLEKLQHMPLVELITLVLRKQIDLQSKIQLLEAVQELVKQKPKLLDTKPKAYDDLLEAKPRMEQDLLELNSIVYWLSKVRQ